MMFATSCENELDLGTNAGENAQVTFSVGTPEIATRAYSDGQTATVLQYAVYDAEGNELTDLTVTDAEIHGSTTVNLQLTTGNTYSVIFWAAAENAPYTVDFGAKTMTVDYDKAVSNDETRDAFYKYHTFTVKGAQTETIELKRPFAQLNIGTADYAASTSAGYTPAYSYVKVPVSKVLNLVDGSVDTAADVEFALAAIPQGETFPVSGYDYLSMNYLLVPADKEVVDLTFGYSESNTTVEKTRTVGSVPVQRNYRTNIYGQLFTSDVNINVEIVPDYYDDEYNNEHGFIVAEGKVLVSSAEGLQILAERMANGELMDGNIVLEGDIDLSELAVATRSSAVYNWTPMGTPEKPFTGTFDGQGHTIKNLNIVETEAKEGKAYIGFFGYANNATIKNVTFENVNLNIACLDIDHSQGHIGAVAGSLEGTSTIENVTVKGDIFVEATVTANGASRVAVVAGGNVGGNVTMKNVHVVANKGSYLKANNNVGALAGQLQVKNVFENCSSNIDVTATKFFAGGLIGIAAGDSQFTNCHTTGDVTVTAGREGRANDQYRVGGIAGGWADGKTKVCTLTNCSYTGTVSGTNADGSVAEKLDYLGYVGRGYTLNGCAGSKVVINGVSFVQVGDAAPFGNYEVTGADGEAVVAAGSKEDLPKTDDGSKIDTDFEENVTLFGDITVSASETNANSGYGATGVTVTDGAVLDGMGNTLTVTNAGGTWDCVVAAKGGTIKNLTVAGAMRGIFMPGANGDVYIDNVIFKDVIYTFNSDAGNKNYGVYISNSTLNGWTSHSDAHKEVVYTNCNFGEGSGYAYCRPYGPTSFVGCAFEAGFEIDARGKITFENCTLGGVALTAENLATLVTSRVENASIK